MRVGSEGLGGVRGELGGGGWMWRGCHAEQVEKQIDEGPVS